MGTSRVTLVAVSAALIPPWHCASTSTASVLLTSTGAERTAVVDTGVGTRGAFHCHIKGGSLDVTAFYTHADRQLSHLCGGVGDLEGSVMVILDRGLESSAGLFV